MTVIEMLAASPVHPAVLSYELDMHDRQTTVGSKVWNRPACDLGFLGASGNVTGFMMPWDRVFSLLKSTLTGTPRGVGGSRERTCVLSAFAQVIVRFGRARVRLRSPRSGAR